MIHWNNLCKCNDYIVMRKPPLEGTVTNYLCYNGKLRQADTCRMDDFH